MTITRTMYLDMIQQFLIPQLEEDDQEGHSHFQQDGTPPHYFEEVCTSTPVAQVVELVERRQ
jgi:hypothetical protein